MVVIFIPGAGGGFKASRGEFDRDADEPTSNGSTEKKKGYHLHSDFFETSVHFLVACTRLYKALCRSVSPSVRRSDGQ